MMNKQHTFQVQSMIQCGTVYIACLYIVMSLPYSSYEGTACIIRFLHPSHCLRSATNMPGFSIHASRGSKEMTEK